jgi:hypothetical protein
LSFAYPEVCQYKLDLIQEQAAYGVDNVCLDFFRENHLFGERHHQLIPKQEGDLDGVCIFGYEPPIVDAFKRQFGIDPHNVINSDEAWVRFRANYLTAFMKKVREMLNKWGITLTAKVRSMNRIQAPFPYWEPEYVPTNSLLGSFVDWPTWAEQGLLDEIMLVYEMLDLCKLEPMSVLREARAAKEIIGDQAKLMVAIWCYNLNDHSVADGERALDIGANAALQGGADGVVLWESTPIHGWGSNIGGAGGSEFGLWSKVKELARRPSAVLFT